MGHVRDTIHINAPIERVWDLYADPSRMPEWDTNTLEVRDFPERIDEAGAKFTSIVRVMGRKMTGSSETTRVERPLILEQKAKLPGGGHATATLALTESGGGTDMTMTADYELPLGMFSGVAEKLLAGSIEWDSRHASENFKALCEATMPMPAERPRS